MKSSPFGPVVRGALVAVGLGGVGSAYFLLPLLPSRLTWTLDLQEQLGLVLYGAVGLGLAWLGGAMHASRAKA